MDIEILKEYSETLIRGLQTFANCNVSVKDKESKHVVSWDRSIFEEAEHLRISMFLAKGGEEGLLRDYFKTAFINWNRKTES